MKKGNDAIYVMRKITSFNDYANKDRVFLS